MTKKQKERADAKKLKEKIKQYQITHKRHGFITMLTYLPVSQLSSEPTY